MKLVEISKKHNETFTTMTKTYFKIDYQFLSSGIGIKFSFQFYIIETIISTNKGIFHKEIRLLTKISEEKQKTNCIQSKPEMGQFLKVFTNINQSIKTLDFIINTYPTKQTIMTEINSSIFSSNSAFQRCLLPSKLVQKVEIFVQSDLLQNQPQTSKQIQVNKTQSLPLQNPQKKQPINQQNFHDFSSQQNAKEEFSSIAKTLDDHRSVDLKKRRKTKKEIACNEKDEGRGGNCIASNITKTLLRIIKIKVNNTLWNEFNSFSERYKIKSQKQNIIILLLILYVFVKQGKLQVSFFQDILGDYFFKSLEESRSNCEKKMELEPQRRFFHLKNRKMYNKFIEISIKLFESLKVALNSEITPILKLNYIEEIIADTYDRKQRQVEKAINKIKSIILNHSELKQLFRYPDSDIFQTFYDSMGYAYRRNLPKRYNQMLQNVTKFIDQFREFHNLSSMNEKYYVCLLATKYMGEKQRQIWDQFIENMNMKRQFNSTQSEIEEMNNFLRIEIYQQIGILEQLQKKRELQQQSECKQQQSDTEQNQIKSLYRTYLELSSNKSIC